ncbi:probable G-protein coupled receptor B0563.6 isoform X2 [Cephus cinctus]|uniref:Probable G-protein coupled receptor B0563.6 isoform X2 n=1 Tax=Cephus cinctus TaxID=211228 RepID=A0AAJ7C593_CEPCN|nr:probable G-protein coupled receptor B0563.6 isoform X2 [Cephus cinctus]
MLTGLIDGAFSCCDSNYSTERYEPFGDDEEAIRKELLHIEWAVHRIATPAILTFGLLGNILTLAALSGPSFRGVTYLYLTGLAVADIGVLISWIPVAIRLGYGMNKFYLAALYHAHIELVLLHTFMAASIFIMASLTVDRYVSVFFPARLRSGNIRRNANSLIIASFMLGFMISIPLGGMRLVYEQQDGPDLVFILQENTSITRNELWTAYLWGLESLVRIGPSLVFVFLNTLVIKRFLQLTAKRRRFHAVSDKYRATHVAETSSLMRNRGYREEQQLVILLSAIVIFFFLTTTPAICVTLIYPIKLEKDLNYQRMRAIVNLVEISNFALKFLLYFACSTDFRSAALRTFQGRCKEEVRDMSQEPPVGEIEDFSRHGTTFRMSPEHTKLNSPGSPSKLNEEKELQ